MSRIAIVTALMTALVIPGTALAYTKCPKYAIGQPGVPNDPVEVAKANRYLESVCGKRVRPTDPDPNIRFHLNREGTSHSEGNGGDGDAGGDE